MHAEEALGDEIVLDHRPVLTEEGIDVAPHQQRQDAQGLQAR